MFLRLPRVFSSKVLRGFRVVCPKNSLILYQAASRPDEVNCNVHETLALNNGSRHGDNPKTS